MSRTNRKLKLFLHVFNMEFFFPVENDVEKDRVQDLFQHLIFLDYFLKFLDIFSAPLLPILCFDA